MAIVAELTTNHFGDRGRLENLIRAAHQSGADQVKLQKRDVASFYSPSELAAPYASPFGTAIRDYRTQLELTEADFELVDKLCASLGIGWFASVLDQPSFEFLLQFSPTMIKLPSTISGHTEFLRYVAENYTGSVVLSTGMTDADCNVAVVRHYHDLSREDARIVPGYSSHDTGWLASALAVAAGARMVEKHVKFGSTAWAHFDEVAVDMSNDDFAAFVRRICETESILGSPVKAVTENERHKYPCHTR